MGGGEVGHDRGSSGRDEVGRRGEGKIGGEESWTRQGWEHGGGREFGLTRGGARGGGGGRRETEGV